MSVVKCPTTGETIIYLTEKETAEMKQMIAGASLPLKRTFNEILAL